MHLHRRLTLAVSLASLAAIGAIALACGPASPTPDTNPDLYELAINGAPGGALLAVWGDNSEQKAWLVGGYVGVDPTTVPDRRVGRLVEYANGTFVTRCTTDQVLWWVTGVRDGGSTAVWAVGEGGKVLRYRDGRCTELPLGITFDEGPPTFWGILARATNDFWLVGGSAQPNGPRGVIVRGDGAGFRRVTPPTEAAEQNLYKVSQTSSSLVIVGAGNTILRGTLDGVFASEPAPARGGDNRLFTVSCFGSECYAVGGAASGFVLHIGGFNNTLQPDAASPWSEFLRELPGMNGVWMQDSNNVWMVGANGTTVHTNGIQVFRPSTMLTQATLHGVGGIGTSVVIAVGGELGVSNASQRAVVLVRDASRSGAVYTFDGMRFQATGSLRRSLGAVGQ